jgi:lysine 2,3-aminomutase
MEREKSKPPTKSLEPPGTTSRSPWENVPESAWNDWRWQLSHSLTKAADFKGLFELTPQEEQAVHSPGLFRMGITPYFASLIDPDNPQCPIRRQVIPIAAENQVSMEEMVDSLAEDQHSPVPGLVHRYPDRVLILVNTQCASYCRFCTRSRLVGDPHHQFTNLDYQRQIDYIAANPSIRDVLLSGGDPLILPQQILESILIRLREIPHVEVIRIGTRVPIFLPMRIDASLCDMLGKYHPLWMNIHVNHPKELSPGAAKALARLADAGIPLGSQTVLLAGINDCPQLMKKLFQNLVSLRVRPYYLYQCDQVPGSSHFRTSIGAGLEIIENLRGHTSGFAVPTYVIDAPEGGGKVPLSPQYLISHSDHTAVIRNYEGLIAAYNQPEDYTRHKPEECSLCLSAGQTGQAGISALLSGSKRSLIPETWQSAHQRSIPLPENLQPSPSLMRARVEKPQPIQGRMTLKSPPNGKKHDRYQ